MHAALHRQRHRCRHPGGSNEIVDRHPLRLLVGEHDPTFTPELMEKTYLCRYRHATMEVLRNAGHYPMNETPLALVAAMEAFLAPRC